jgi:hypothetical protein
MSWRSKCLLASSGLALLVCGTAGASAGSVAISNPAGGSVSIIHKVHSVYEAEQTLYRRGYYDVRVERASLPYSFSACKRGVRYHVHVDYYGDLVQVDPIGRCYGDAYGSRYDDRRGYYGRYRYREED